MIYLLVDRNRGISSLMCNLPTSIIAQTDQIMSFYSEAAGGRER